jgi:hypothetical protein
VFRTDANHNPTAFTTDVAAQGGLILGKDYERGEAFEDLPYQPGSAQGTTYYTALLMGDPVQLTIRVIDAIGFQTKVGLARWAYINMPRFVWCALEPTQKRDVIGYMYRMEGGTAMRNLFPNWSED